MAEKLRERERRREEEKKKARIWRSRSDFRPSSLLNKLLVSLCRTFWLKIRSDDAIKNLHALCLGETLVRDEPAFISSELKSEENEREGAINAQNTEVKAAVFPNVESNLGIKETHRSSWVDIFVQEMMNASDWHDVRNRAIKILESFKQMIVAQSTSSKEQEIVSLKEQLQCLLRDNQILKRAVTIQHEQNSEFAEKLKEVQQLKNIISQYQEQVRTLELNNYTLKIHLQRAQEATSIPGRFHPDIF